MTRRELGGASIGAGLVALGAAGCGRRRAPDPDSITVLYGDDETALGPDQGDPAQFLMFLPLAEYDASGHVKGRLAEYWEHSPDYRTLKIRLRNGIRWHDGMPVTAHDIKFTIDLMTHPDVLWWTPGSFDVRVIDDLTYTITRRGNGMRATVWDDWAVYYPKHLLEHLDPKGFWTWDFWKQPVGNGPYRYVRHLPKTMMELEANPDYYWGRPKIPKVVLKFGNAQEGAVTELLTGDVDAVNWVKRSDVLELSRDGRFRVYNQVRHSPVRALFWNHRSPLFREAKVRKALTLAIDRRELMQALGFPDEAPVVDAPVSQAMLYRRELAAPIPYDPLLANRLLDEAGWTRRNRRGIRERDGTAFEFEMITGPGDTGAVYVEAQLKRIGAHAKVTILEYALTNQRMATGDYQAALWGMGGASIQWWDDGSMEGLRVAGYDSSRFVALMQEFRAAYGPAEEDRLFRELTQLFQEDVPATFLYPDVWTTIASRRILGLDACPYRGDPTWCMGSLALEGQA